MEFSMQVEVDECYRMYAIWTDTRS